jgi:hypothetical protein
VTPRLLAPALIWLAGAILAAPVAADLERPSRLKAVPGAEGVVRTVVDGDGLEEIPVRFIGTYEGVLGPGRDLYLVELLGDTAEEVGVAFGMSGSPVYVDGEVVGALAYRYGLLPVRPIAGITPIEDVLDASRAGTAVPSASAASAAPGTPLPIATPVVLGGTPAPIAEWIAPLIEAHGFVVVQGGGPAGTNDRAEQPLEPGRPVGVRLVGGDWNVGATGTITWVEDGRVYAFGHPFLGSGVTEFPMTSVNVLHTLADRSGSFKMATMGRTMGAVLEDRLTAIVGRIGASARTVPMRMTVRGASYGERAFRFDISPHRQLGAALVGGAVGTALLREPGFENNATLTGRGVVRLADLPELPLEMAFSGEGAGNPAVAAAGRVQLVLSALFANRFATPQVESIEMEFELRHGRHEYGVETLLYDRGPVRPGETRRFEAVLRGYRGERIRRAFDVVFPSDLTPGSPLLLAVGADSFLGRASGQTLAKKVATSDDLPALVRALGTLRSSHRLTAGLYRPADGFVAAGDLLDELPGSASRLLASGHAQSTRTPTRAAELLRLETPMDGPVLGGATARLRVQDGPAAEE